MEIIKFTEAASMDYETESHQGFVSSIKYAAPIHNHDFYEIFLITKGSTVHNVNHEKQLLKEGALVFMRPEDVHFYDYDHENDCQFINIPYMSSAIEDVFNYLGEAFNPQRLLTPKLPPVAVLSPLEKENLISRFEKLYILPNNSKSQIRIQLRSLLVEMLTQYFPNTQGNFNKELPLWLESLLTSMQKKENFTQGLQKMYELSGRSIGHVNRAFKQYFNTTPTFYINSLRLNYAKSLLINSRSSIIEISMEAGFDNLSHFYHTFRKRFNMTPTELRNNRPEIT